MPFHLATSFKAQVEETAKKMERESLDACEIPASAGMVLVRAGSAEYQHRQSKPGMIILVPVTVDGTLFTVCAC